MSATHHEVQPGGMVEVSGRRVGEPARLGEILEVLGHPDHPHYRVRWEDGHETIIYPGETTTIKEKSPASHAPQAELSEPTQRLVATLTAAGIEFELLRHPRTTTASAEARALGLISQAVAKTVIARDAQGVHVRAVVPASRHVSIPKLERTVSATDVVLLTEPELVAAYPQFEVGAVPPFGGPAGDTIVVDSTLTEQDHVVFDAGVHDVALRLRTEDLITVAEAQTADIAAG